MKKIGRNKKGLELNALYGFVLMIVLVGMILGVGLITLDRLQQNSAVGLTNTTAFAGVGGVSAAIGSTITSVAGISTTWLSLIITIAVLAIIMTLVVRSFAGRR